MAERSYSEIASLMSYITQFTDVDKGCLAPELRHVSSSLLNEEISLLMIAFFIGRRKRSSSVISKRPGKPTRACFSG